ncbi:S8 family serine peptidase [Clostridium sporogenes]|uniref:S8 family serine peptidase n=1 Tax=Clostridium sporogenes TaxID=1509 RepID=UPI0022382A8A|nr:S8 family serine peptidase [Clostridium sporogenes]MCW6076235.1 S8 family serine peptidase [Clostridium sporogenes]
MFSFKNKIEETLKIAIKNNYYKNYRVLIICTNLQKDIEKKVKLYKGRILKSIALCNCVCAYVSSRAIERLLEYPQVIYICLDPYAYICGNSVCASNNVTISERYSLTGQNIGIGVVDTGVYPHTDLINPTNRIKSFLDLINNYNYPYDDNGHGTFISGVIAGNGSLSDGLYKGIAPKSHLCVVKAFNKLGKGFVSDILFGIENLINIKEEFNIKIICLPFEVPSINYNILDLFSKIFNIALNDNIIIIVPSGHNGNSEGSIQGIATLKSCITVGGIDTTSLEKKPYIYSSSGPFSNIEKPDLAAAAVNICSLNSNTNYISEKRGKKIYPRPLEEAYTNFTGTSCAAAYISGVCSLLFENNQELIFKDILSLMKVSCSLLPFSKWIQGAGVIDINKLLP